MSNNSFFYKKICAFLSVIMVMAFMTGCGGSATGTNGYPQSAPSSMKGNGFFSVESVEMEDSISIDREMMKPTDNDMGATDTISREIERKLVYTANVDLESKDYEASLTQLKQQVQAFNGYLEETSQYGSRENGNRYYNVTIRIPSDKYRDFLDATGSMGSVIRMSESMQDVTTNYIDVQARISSLEAQRDRLAELRKQAASLEDLMAIENRMSDVQYQLDNYMGQMKYLERQVSYSTVYLNLREVVTYTPANTFGSRLKRAMTGTWSDFFAVMGDILIGVIYLIPYLLILAVIVFGGKAFWRNIRRKRAAKKQEQENQKLE